MSGAKLLAEARGHLAERGTVRLVLDGRDDPIEVHRISAPDTSGLMTAQSDGLIERVRFYSDSLIAVLPSIGTAGL